MFPLTRRCDVCSVIPQRGIQPRLLLRLRQSCYSTVAVVREDSTQACMENGTQVCQALNKLGLAEFPCGFCPHELNVGSSRVQLFKWMKTLFRLVLE